MKHILVPIGSTENAESTLQYAIDFATEFNAKVFVFRAYSAQKKAGTMVNIDKIIQRETKLYLRAMVQSVDRKEVEVQLISAKGNVITSIEAVHKELGIDLIIMGPKSNSIKEEVFLGSTSGSIVKKTEIPILIAPKNSTFSAFKNILTVFNSGVIKEEKALEPLQKIMNKYQLKSNLLLVKTPKHIESDLVLDAGLESLKAKLTITENATAYQGVLEHFQSHNPDLLCVFRRKRGFFKKLWEKNTVLKKEFYCNIPLLILSGKE